MTISSTYAQMKTAIADWRDHLANMRHIRNGNSIIWDKFKPLRLPDEIFLQDYDEIDTSGQYSLQTAKDGSFFQLHYRFDNSNNLSAANLSFIASPDYVEENYEHTEERSVIEYQKIQMPWLRIDFDPTTARNIVHSGCHLHLAGFPKSRFPVHRVPSPYQFIEFIFSTLYPSLYREKRLDENYHLVPADIWRSINEISFDCRTDAQINHVLRLTTPIV